MKKSIISIIFILLLTAVLPAAKSEPLATRNVTELIQFLITGKNNTAKSGLTRKKLKKIIRKAGRVYRTVKPGSENRKKSRKIQRKARRIINIF